MFYSRRMNKAREKKSKRKEKKETKKELHGIPLIQSRTIYLEFIIYIALQVSWETYP